MISIIYGTKGTGKTKQIIGQANAAIENLKGDIFYITDTNEYTLDIDRQIKYVACHDIAVKSVDSFIAFLEGMFAANYDIQTVFIDGIARITKTELKDLEPAFDVMKKLAENGSCNFVLTVSSSKEDLPEFVAKFAQ